MHRLEPARSALLVVDVQTRLAQAMPAATFERLSANASILLESARMLGVPVLATEQYPKGLGPTVDALSARLRSAGVAPAPKMTFDASAAPTVARHLAERAPRSVVLLGMETHVCIFQTAREITRRGIEVHVVADAVASRTEENRRLGLALCERVGVFVTPTEAVLFDWLERAGTTEFKALSHLVR